MAPKTPAQKAKAVVAAKAKATAIAPLAVGAPTVEDVAAANIEREITAQRAVTAQRAAEVLLTAASPAEPGAPGRVGTSATPRPSRRPSPTGSPAGGEEHLAPSDTGDKTKDTKEHKRRRRHSSDGGDRDRRRRRRGNDEARHMFETKFFTKKRGLSFTQVQPHLAPLAGEWGALTYLGAPTHRCTATSSLSRPGTAPSFFFFRNNKTGVTIDASSAPPRPPPRRRMGEHRYLCAPIHRCTATSSLSRPSNSHPRLRNLYS